MEIKVGLAIIAAAVLVCLIFDLAKRIATPSAEKLKALEVKQKQLEREQAAQRKEQERQAKELERVEKRVSALELRVENAEEDIKYYNAQIADADALCDYYKAKQVKVTEGSAAWERCENKIRALESKARNSERMRRKAENTQRTAQAEIDRISA